MERIKYQLFPDWLEGEPLQVEGYHLPRVGDILELDLHTSHEGRYKVVAVDHLILASDNATAQLLKAGRKEQKEISESSLDYIAYEAPHVLIEKIKEE